MYGSPRVSARPVTDDRSLTDKLVDGDVTVVPLEEASESEYEPGEVDVLIPERMGTDRGVRELSELDREELFVAGFISGRESCSE